MPSVSQKQHNLMAMVANNPSKSKQLGIPQSVGQEFTQADKGKSFGAGAPKTRADRQVANRSETNHGKEAIFKKGGQIMATKNTSRMNRLEELGRVDAEKARTSKGKANLAAEKKRIVGEMKYAKGGAIDVGNSTKMGSVRNASPSRDGVASKGKTRGTQIVMAGNKGMKKGGKVC